MAINLFKDISKMKKIFNLNYYTLLIAFGSVLLIAAGCKKINTSENLDTPRIFKPGSLSVAAGQNSAKVTWTAPLFGALTGKLKYTAEFSQDTTFATTEFTLTSDTLGVTASDDKLAVRKKYWVRVKASADGQADSKWIESSKFSITGTQLFQTIRETEIKETSVTLRFTPTTGLAKITMTPATGAATDVTLSAADAAAGIKVVTGLTPNTAYSAELFDTKSKGYVTFTTLPLTVYTVTLNPGDDLAAAIASAANNAVIGLNPGTYTVSAAISPIISKTITLKSTSYNPKDTKINFKEFTLKGTGAGLNIVGIECDGTGGAAAYFINCTGVAADAELCTYTNVTVDNCIIHGVTTAFFRGNRGAAAGDYKITAINIKNTLAYDIASLLNFTCITLDKMQFSALNITKSTFYNFGNQLITAATTLSTATPTITIDQSTFNNFGASSKNAIMNASANPVNVIVTNSIFGNIPRPAGAVPAAVINATATSTSITFANNNIFKATTAVGGTTVVTLPASAANNQAIDLGWIYTTTDFTLPVGSSLRTSSTIGGAIGDPRWTY